MEKTLLEEDEPPAVLIENRDGRGRALLTCDHASPRLPKVLGDLGVSEADRLTHIGWDLGAAKLARHLCALLDAPLILTNYSRLVIDTNRPPHVASSIPEVTGGVPIPQNQKLCENERELRKRTFFDPYHQAIDRLLTTRQDLGLATDYLAIHSFTPSLYGKDRPWQVGILYGKDRRLADRLLACLVAEGDLVVGDNQPYQVTPQTDYGVPVHGEGRGLPCVLIEVRQDVLEGDGARAWAERLARIYLVCTKDA